MSVETKWDAATGIRMARLSTAVKDIRDAVMLARAELDAVDDAIATFEAHTDFMKHHKPGG